MIVRMARRNDETLIIVTHDGDIARYADRIVRLVDGAIIIDTPNVSIVPPESVSEETRPIRPKKHSERNETK